jgi:hypothetical protein
MEMRFVGAEPTISLIGAAGEAVADGPLLRLRLVHFPGNDQLFGRIAFGDQAFMERRRIGERVAGPK